MIAANELRIGNWVRYGNRIFKIHCISETYPFLNTEEFGVGVVGFKNIEPIVLCPIILEKLDYYQYDEENNRWIHPDFKEYYMQEKELYFGTSSIKVEYLHDLQNLLFALTRKEIIFNPKP